MDFFEKFEKERGRKRKREIEKGRDRKREEYIERKRNIRKK